ncbi:hypothetical protein H9L39_14096 [Fusarium oxysporum f. sp. albedinis]|jgi:hypothetical protein|nr:hypothetical protein H9L39_14096 [Fusarium oxysporum f. sp. albedinis]
MAFVVQGQQPFPSIIVNTRSRSRLLSYALRKFITKFKLLVSYNGKRFQCSREFVATGEHTCIVPTNKSTVE